MPLPGAADANAALAALASSANWSAPRAPTNWPAVSSVAAVVPSATLLATVVPLTVSVRAVISDGAVAVLAVSA